MDQAPKVDHLDAVRRVCAASFPAFVTFSAESEGQTAVPDHHMIMASFLQGRKPEWVARIKEILGFRLAAKSWLLRKYNLWRWLRNPYTQVIIQSSRDGLAKKMARAQLNDLRLNPLVSHLAPKGATGEYEFNVRGVVPELGMSLTCAGIKTSVTSSRADVYEFDDPEPDDNPEALRDHIKRTMEESQHILHAPENHLRRWQSWGANEIPTPERTQLIVVGQPHYEGTVYLPNEQERLMDDGEDGHPLNDAIILKIPATRHDGTWTWPYMMERKYYNVREGRPMAVKEVKNGMSRSNWCCQMEIRPGWADKIGNILRVEHIESVATQPRRPVMAIDPADSLSGCEWGIAIGGMASSKLHLQYIGGLTGDVYDWIDEDETQFEGVWSQVFDLADQMNVQTFILEVNLAAAIRSLERYAIAKGRSYNVIPWRATQSKLKRIVSTLEPVCNSGMFSADPAVMADQKTSVQFRTLRHAKLPVLNDRLDATEMLTAYHLEEYPSAFNMTSPMAGGRRRPRSMASTFDPFQSTGVAIDRGPATFTV